jgi:hypothetical protein
VAGWLHDCSPHVLLQISCMLLDDKVPNRWHWPVCTDLKINNIPYRVYARSSNTKLGVNQRDEVANVGVLCCSGDGRNFFFMIFFLPHHLFWIMQISWVA